MIKKFIEKLIFSSKWLLIPFYLGLFVAMLIYTFVYVKEIFSLIVETPHITKNIILLSTLELVDIVMIANLVKTIITGSYTSFVDKTHENEAEKTSSGLLKVKMGTSLIGISSIHLLQSFINIDNVTWIVLQNQIIIHVTFLVGSLVLAVVDYLHQKSYH